MRFSELTKRAVALEDLPSHYCHPLVAKLIADLCESGQGLEAEVSSLRATVLSLKGLLDAKASDALSKSPAAESSGEGPQGAGSASAEGILGTVGTKTAQHDAVTV